MFERQYIGQILVKVTNQIVCAVFKLTIFAPPSRTVCVIQYFLHKISLEKIRLLRLLRLYFITFVSVWVDRIQGEYTIRRAGGTGSLAILDYGSNNKNLRILSKYTDTYFA